MAGWSIWRKIWFIGLGAAVLQIAFPPWKVVTARLPSGIERFHTTYEFVLDPPRNSQLQVDQLLLTLLPTLIVVGFAMWKDKIFQQ
jgi:hypothetical protein